jgi:hypothetical protein
LNYKISLSSISYSALSGEVCEEIAANQAISSASQSQLGELVPCQDE